MSAIPQRVEQGNAPEIIAVGKTYTLKQGESSLVMYPYISSDIIYFDIENFGRGQSFEVTEMLGGTEAGAVGKVNGWDYEHFLSRDQFEALREIPI